MSGCRKYGPVVILENFQPSRDIGGVFFARLLVKFEIGAQESRSQLGNEFFAAVTFIAPALAAEVTVKALRVFCPVGQFVSLCCAQHKLTYVEFTLMLSSHLKPATGKVLGVFYTT